MALKKLWAIGVKVRNIEQELTFHRQMGHSIVLDETANFDDNPFRLLLVKMGDKYLNLSEVLAYERVLGETRPIGSTHMVYVTDQFDQDTTRALASGATMIGEVATISGGFGTRKIAFFKAPGGWFFEFFEMILNLVPE